PVTRQRLCRGLAAKVFPDGNKLHLRGDDACAGISKLGDRFSVWRPQRSVTDRELWRQPVAGDEAIILRLHLPPLIGFHVAASHDPAFSQAWKAAFDGDLGGGLGIGARSVVDG